MLDPAVPTRADIDPRDLSWQFTRGSGKGGQNRNKRDSVAVLTHLPTGIVVRAEDERTQGANRSIALDRLRTILDEQGRSRVHQTTNAQRHVDAERSFTWTAWRNEVKGPGGTKTQMTRALSGRLDQLMEGPADRRRHLS